MSTLSSANVTDVNLVLKERTHMRLCINMLISTHNLGNWLIIVVVVVAIVIIIIKMWLEWHYRCMGTLHTDSVK